MDRPAGADGFADLLQELRVRSGRSYDDLARATFTSRSTLHRYCTGAGLPVDDDVVLRLGEACGADPGELDDLVRRWKTALADRESGAVRPAPAAVEPSAPDPLPVEPEGAEAVGPAPGRSRRRAVLLAAGLAVVVLAGAVVVTVRGGDAPASAGPTGATGEDVCVNRSDVRRADGPTGAFDATWTADQLCPNEPNVPVFLTPLAREDDPGAQAGTLYSTESWFVCWTAGRLHSGGNRIWYYTQGDVSHPDHRDRRAWGFVPARYLDTVVDPDPGTPQCPALRAGS
ncbi:hypothetical protein GCM10009547_35160 [Sporichthya brevicatena]|uniref:HTH cro/C1-type domain-containing protein n=1 Tax=Sporichthya brevicatena TaxID=171442 RepID=A0ABN1H482_9ACTN